MLRLVKRNVQKGHGKKKKIFHVATMVCGLGKQTNKNDQIHSRYQSHSRACANQLGEGRTMRGKNNGHDYFENNRHSLHVEKLRFPQGWVEASKG